MNFDFLRDSIWQFIGVFIAVVSCLISIAIYLKQRNLKEISYERLSDTLVLSNERNFMGKIQLLLNGIPINNVRIVILKIKNSGKVSVLPTDYIDPIEIFFGDYATALDVEVLETKPYDIWHRVGGQLNVNSLTITPLLLNSGDFIILKVLLTPSDPIVDATGRIIGVKNIHDEALKVSYKGLTLSLGYLTAFVLFYFYSINKNIYLAIIAQVLLLPSLITLYSSMRDFLHIKWPFYMLLFLLFNISFFISIFIHNPALVYILNLLPYLYGGALLGLEINKHKFRN